MQTHDIELEPTIVGERGQRFRVHYNGGVQGCCAPRLNNAQWRQRGHSWPHCGRLRSIPTVRSHAGAITTCCDALTGTELSLRGWLIGHLNLGSCRRGC